MSTISNNKERFIIELRQPDGVKNKSLSVVVCKKNILDKIPAKDMNKDIFIITVLRVRANDNKEKMLLSLYGESIDEPDKKITDNELCELIVSFSNLEHDLNQLKEYGTGFITRDITNIAHNIIEHYRDIPVVSSKNISDLKLSSIDIDIAIEGLFEQIKKAVNGHEEFISQYENDENGHTKELDDDYLYSFKKKDADYYDVPVKLINDIINDANLPYTPKELKNQLKAKGYIQISSYSETFTAHRTMLNGSSKAYKAYRISNIMNQENQTN